MTGPVAYEYEGRFDPELFCRPAGAASMTVDVITFGCRLNAYESEVIRRNAEAAGPRRHRGGQHLRGDRRGGAAGEQTIRRIARERPDARIVVTGCAAQIEPRDVRRHAEVDRVLGNEEKLDAKAWRETRAALDAPAIRHRPARRRSRSTTSCR